MTYDEFKKYFLDEVSKKLPGDVCTKVEEIKKINGVKVDGVTFFREGVNCSPRIYLEGYYKKYVDGDEINTLVDTFVNCYEKNQIIIENCDFDFFKDYERVKDRIFFKVINKEKNEELLKEVPYREFLDLAIVYYYLLDEKLIKENLSTILITNKILEMWEINEEEIKSAAFINTPQLFPLKVESMERVLTRLLGRNIFIDIDTEALSCTPLYVISNDRLMYGAGAMLYKDALKNIAGRTGEDMYIIPSSINELIVAPVSFLETDFIISLKDMINMVNKNEVAEQEVLSNNLYFYSKTLDRIVII